MDLAAFAAQRRTLLEDGDRMLAPSVRTSLVRYWRTPTSDWSTDVIEAVGRLFDLTFIEEGGQASDETAVARDNFLDTIRDSMEKTSPPADDVYGRRVQQQRITRWLSTATVNAATIAAAQVDGEEPTLTWVTMRDDDVRDTHRPLDGVEVPLGDKFDVGGHPLSYPGEPVGPPEVWIECRCVVRPGRGGSEMANKTSTFEVTAEEEEVIVDEAPGGEGVEEVEEDIRVPFHAVLAPIGVKTGDGRIFKTGSLTFRDGPSPIALRWTPTDVGAHGGAVRVGNFTRAWIDEDGTMARGEGYFLVNESSEQVISMLAESPLGISVDLDSMVMVPENEDGSEFDFEAWAPGEPEPLMAVTEGRISGATIVDIPAFQEAFIALGPWEETEEPVEVEEEQVLVAAGCQPCETLALLEGATEEERAAFESALEQEFAPGTKDGPGWITNPEDTQRLRRYWTKGAGAAKIRWGQPGDFNRCRQQLAKYVKNPNWLAGTCANLHKVALGVWPGQEASAVTASGDPSPAWTLTGKPSRVLPAEWFGDPNFSAPTPLTILDNGQVFGHVAAWGVCHISIGASIGASDACITAPHSNRDYAYFKTGAVRTTIGDVAVGNITMDTGHANLRLTQLNAAKHYDQTGTVVADINVGEDEHGIWFAGALRPGLDPEKIDALRAASLSGDWRQVGTSQEMVAALAVNVPGFPIVPAALAASGARQDSLVAAGVLPPHEEQPQVGIVEAFDINVLAAAVAKAIEHRTSRAERVAAARAAARAQRLSAARSAFAK